MLLLLDYKNLPLQRVPLASILGDWIGALDTKGQGPGGTAEILVRAYGGWYRQTEVSPERFAAAKFLPRWCSSLVQVGGRYCRVSLEFADQLLADRGVGATATDSPRITHTVSEFRTPPIVSAASDAVECGVANCHAPDVLRMQRKRRACTQSACPLPFSDRFVRIGQKQVDIHLAVDLLASVSPDAGWSAVAVASDDLDIVPAIFAAAGRGVPPVAALRVDRPDSYADGRLRERGVHIVRSVRAKESRS